MEKTINPSFNEEAFLSLTEESQMKVECIYHIAHMLYVNRLPKMDAEEFDKLYDMPLNELDLVAGNVQAQLRYRKQLYENIEGE